MKILVIGGTGMLGHRLWSSLSKNHDVYATVRNKVSELNHLPHIDLEKAITDVDVNNLNSVEEAIKKIGPDYVLNCVGIIKQIDASKNHITSIKINSLLPHELTSICEKYNSKLVHFSTDCVFDGAEGFYNEQHQSNATDLYGRSKFLGEVDYSKHCLTMRTSIIGREIFPKGSLIEWFLSQEGEIKGFDKAIYTGYPTETIARILDSIVFKNPDLSGVLNVASPKISKFDLLNLVKDHFGKEITIHKNSDFVLDRSLDGKIFNEKTGFNPPSWEELVKDLSVDNEYYENLRS
ncbi:SDR family oxidoreductase [Halobacteriovorax sp. GB3]|uniref:dTDP-4-dehydrorhamnose reductase family protein n=1 Tax=Halobacteriovorax sp. GB3 TaxID=2719615 RepID=UPI0023601D40|nr:SDR family oxidoreductase [Halobacteriovorax sp. GB3]MDD0852524.1 SDR family oxidoreductase [Halobacteriovorax sp. GB3]